MKVTIRRAIHTDSDDIIVAHVRSIRGLCSKDYTQEQIEAWAGRNFKASLWDQAIDRDFVWVVEVDAKVLGFGHLALMDEKTGEVMGLYFTPELKGQGAGKKLLGIMKLEAQIHGIKELNLFATLTAKSFYQSQGFSQVSGDLSIEMRGIQIPCFPMKCFL
jgi:putative acetyltransferase